MVISASSTETLHATDPAASVTTAQSTYQAEQDVPSFLNNTQTRFSNDVITIDDIRPLRVAVIGAGLSGILAGILLPAKVPGIELTIFDKNAEVGGTWEANVYPGVRCDVPSHVYQSTFSPNTQWSEIFAQGKEIREYWQSIARKYDVYQYIRFNHRVQGLEWKELASKWTVKFTQSNKKQQQQQCSEEDFDFVLPALGRFDDWRLPDYPGIQDYQGLLRHTSDWDTTFDATNKRVAIIGNGASGVQILPQLQPIAKRVHHYVRSKTWIAVAGAGLARTVEPQRFSLEQLKSFEDPEIHLQYRRALEDQYWRNIRSVYRGSEQNEKFRLNAIELIKTRLSKKPELSDTFIPDFPPFCRRVTPAPGYLEALTADNLDYIQTPIKEFTATGITTIDGVHREVDAIFCATGANVDGIPPFPIVAHGVDLRDAWRPGGKWGHVYTYLGFATPGYPNLLWVMGPHATGTNGTFPSAVENQITYYSKLLRKVSTQRVKTVVPSVAATDDFINYSKKFAAQTVYSAGCRSWANGGKPGSFDHGHWPGSGYHANIVRKTPRWEDWEYTYDSADGNRFSYFGDGWTKHELDPGADLVSYLKHPGQVDLRSLHENWWESIRHKDWDT